MALHGITEREHQQLLERVRQRRPGQQEKLAELFDRYNKQLKALERTIRAYRENSK